MSSSQTSTDNVAKYLWRGLFSENVSISEQHACPPHTTNLILKLKIKALSSGIINHSDASCICFSHFKIRGFSFKIMIDLKQRSKKDKVQVKAAESPSDIFNLILGKPVKRNCMAEYMQSIRKNRCGMIIMYKHKKMSPLTILGGIKKAYMSSNKNLSS